LRLQRRPEKLDPIMHRVAEDGLEESDALIVKTYAMFAPTTLLAIPIGGGFTVANESRTR
jgi:hypothetical protein